MRWSSWKLVPVLAALLCYGLAISGADAEPQLTVYTAEHAYSLPVLERDGKAYIFISDLLSPLGAPPPRVKGKEWRIQFHNSELRLTEGKEKAAVHGGQVDLGGMALVENNRVLVPITAASSILTTLLKTSVEFHQPSRRLFVSNTFVRFAASFKEGEKPSLTLNFSQPVKPDANREEIQGPLFTRMDRTTLTFKKDPLISDTNNQQFGNGAIQSLVFAEGNGAASLTIAGNARLNILRSDDGKTITLEPAAPAAVASPPVQLFNTAPSETQKRTPEFFVMIDPSHGGYDQGASFGGKLLEKDVTLKLARELKKELDQHGILSRMLRDSDVDIALDRRAEITNEQHAGIYIALHAGRPGRGIRVYAPLLANAQQPVGGFLLWESAQSSALDRSKLAAQAVAGELKKNGLSVATLGLPIRPLNNIAGPAIAVELAPEGSELQSIEDPKHFANITSAIASAIAQIRNQMGARQ